MAGGGRSALALALSSALTLSCSPNNSTSAGSTGANASSGTALTSTALTSTASTSGAGVNTSGASSTGSTLVAAPTAPNTSQVGSSAPSQPASSGNATSSLSASLSLPDAAAPAQSHAGGADGRALLEAAQANYLSWQPRTQEPVSVSTQILILCRGPNAAEQAFVDGEHGPNRWLRDWLNPAAQAGFATLEGKDAGAFQFAEGATIVKQKLMGSSSTELIALGFMLKREPGFNAFGDWQYGYWEPNSGLEFGPQLDAHCGGCHTASRTDSVFLDDTWRSP